MGGGEGGIRYFFIYLNNTAMKGDLLDWLIYFLVFPTSGVNYSGDSNYD